ncbi:hypothetical protein [Asticcacaulis tiandongensis]|uniref:hypothetical protein n=1 Tax=Asticcacaulis tiandongensis TaxID=2565365 RepID=UPI0011270551|nr:hypothetical protein [Asticcacaulis tiandongensis]
MLSIRNLCLGLSGLMVFASASPLLAQDQIDENAPAASSLSGAAATGEALWPVPQQAHWGQVLTRDGKNIWKDAVYTDRKGRWQLVYPVTMTDFFGDSLSRDRLYRYPGQPQITCSAMVNRGVFNDLGDTAPTTAPKALIERKDALIERVRNPAYPVIKPQIISLPNPPGVTGTPVQAIQFDQRGKLLELIGVDREIVMRTILVSDGDDLLQVFCSAQPGQKGWVEKQTPVALRLTGLAREAD